jgi:cell division protein FtsW (lipid II flippase)
VSEATAGAWDVLARRRSNRELLLLVLAVLTVLVAYTLIGLAHDATVPAGLASYGTALVVVAAAAHIVRRRYAPAADPVLLPVAFLLNGLGLVMVRRLDFAFEARDNPTAFAPAQTMWTFVSVLAFCATLVLLRDHRVLDRYRYLIGAGSLFLLSLPTLLPEPIGRTINGATLWLNLFGFTIQPAEIAKIGLVVFFASYLADKGDLLRVGLSSIGPIRVPPARALGPVLVTWALSLVILVLQNDLGLSLLFFGVFVVTLYIATGRALYVGLATTMFAAGAWFAYSQFSHVRRRISIWIDVWDQYEDAGYQLAQSLFALGTGGVLGVGLGQGRPDFIPFVETDFIFSAFGEELGLVGLTALLLCYFLLVARGFTVAIRSRDAFGILLAAGLTIIFALQVFVIVGGVTRLIPLSGLTLPFMSYGGSSLLANYVLIALLLRVSSDSASAIELSTARAEAEVGA